MTAIHTCVAGCEWHGSPKRCRGCDQRLPIDLFGPDKRSPDGRNPRCRACCRQQRSAADPGIVRERFLAWKYGISVADYDEMLAAQGGCCAICYGPPTRGRERFDIDHDHSTGVVRGLLCSNCNRAVGLLNDNALSAVRLARYIAGDNAAKQPRSEKAS